MALITVHDKQFKPFIPEFSLADRVRFIAAEIDRDHRDMKPVFIAILKGAFIFAADLFRAVTTPSEICFIKLSSYQGTQSSGKVVSAYGLDIDLSQRHVIIVEDIIDTGTTLHEFLPQLAAQQPASLKICALLHKPDAVKFPLKIDYLGFSIPDKFVVGYGLDYDGLGRNLPHIYQLVENGVQP